MSAKVLRRQLRYLNKTSRRVRQASERLDKGFSLDMLPSNPMLESAIAHSLAYKDGRTTLEFTRHLLSSNLLSLASPVGPWDPYDVKPQVFALDTFIALPVFTSVGYLQHFCSSFNFTVRDPSGNLWASPLIPKLEWPKAAMKTGKPSEGDEKNEGEERKDDASSSASLNADSLYEMMADDTPINTAAPTTGTKKKSRKKGNSKSGRVRLKTRSFADDDDDDTERRRKEGTAAAAAFWNRVSSVPSFGIKKATPLPCFGAFTRPYFVGYFGDVETLLSSTSIVPEKVDVVLNPQSPLELVLARDMTDRVLHRRPLMHLCYQQVERELRGEFHRFFANSCREVTRAYSVCMPEQVSDLTPKNEIPWRILMALESRDFQLTWEKISAAKRSGHLLGHVSLTIIPFDEATNVAKEMMSVFYDRTSSAVVGTHIKPIEAHPTLGVFTSVGPTATVSVDHDADSFYHDPTNAYTEPHSVFADLLKFSPPDLQRE
jgi:hypothetical protein